MTEKNPSTQSTALTFINQVCSSSKTLTEAEKFQDNIDRLHNWSRVWNMEFNVDKCHILHLGKNNKGFNYSMNGQALPLSTKEKDLGIQISDNLKPTAHCNEAARKATATLYSISKSFHFRDKNVFVKLYKQTSGLNLSMLVRRGSRRTLRSWKESRNEWQLSYQILRVLTMKRSSVSQVYTLHTLKYRRDRADLITVYRWIRGLDNVDVNEMFDFYRDTNRTTRLADYEYNIIPKRYRSEVRSNAFTA